MILIYVCFLTAEKESEEQRIIPKRLYKINSDLKTLEQLSTVNNTFPNINSAKSKIDLNADGLERYYQVRIFNETIIFILTPDNLISPAFHEEHFMGNDSRLRFEGGRLHNCYFSGKVLGSEDSAVVLNVCKGLVSNFINYYLITLSLCFWIQNIYVHLHASLPRGVL